MHDRHPEPALEIRNLRKTYPGKNNQAKVALKGLNLLVQPGEIVGLIGENGAGKTTALECALGTRKADSGTARLLGMNPRTQRKKLFHRVGVQFQDTRFQDKITLREACETAASLYARTQDWRPLAKRFGLEGMEHKAVNTLSGGEKQKAAIIIALIPEPEILFLDELTTGLDPAARREVWDCIRELKERGTTILLTSHFMDEVEYLCDRVAILKEGTIVREGRPADLIAAEGAQVRNLENLFIACAVAGKGEN